MVRRALSHRLSNQPRLQVCVFKGRKRRQFLQPIRRFVDFNLNRFVWAHIRFVRVINPATYIIITFVNELIACEETVDVQFNAFWRVQFEWLSVGVRQSIRQRIKRRLPRNRHRRHNLKIKLNND